MSFIDLEYPNTAFFVEVKYSGDIGIGECRVKELPADRDTAQGFVSWFWSYEQARRYARHVAQELGIPTCI